LGRIPTVEEILYMTAQAEGYAQQGQTYNGTGTFEGNFIEGLARNYYEPYEACLTGSWTCSDSKLYKFLSGYQPWWGGNFTPTQRASHLAGQLNNNSYRTSLEKSIGGILNIRRAESQGWTDGYVSGEP
jgi:hypothetical protein